MALNIGNKVFMNLQEAVAWLLENNALPFQSTANYVANTEIAMSTLVNPSPAKVRVGSLIFFADSKVSTVVGVTSNSFIVSDKYNNLVDDIVYVSNVAINASGHLIITLSNGDTIDAGLIKQVSGFSINASQHLIASYNDGTTTDLGAIFSGNINISGTLNVSGKASFQDLTGKDFLKPINLTDQLDIDISTGGTQNNLSDLTTSNCPITITYGHARISNGKLSIVFAGYLKPSENISQALNSGQSLFQSVDFQLSQAMSEKIFTSYGSNVGTGYISWQRGSLTYMQDSGAPAASSQANKISAAIYRGANYKYNVRLFVLDALSLVYNAGFKYDFRFEFNYNL